MSGCNSHPLLEPALSWLVAAPLHWATDVECHLICKHVVFGGGVKVLPCRIASGLASIFTPYTKSWPE